MFVFILFKAHSSHLKKSTMLLAENKAPCTCIQSLGEGFQKKNSALQTTKLYNHLNGKIWQYLKIQKTSISTGTQVTADSTANTLSLSD